MQNGLGSLLRRPKAPLIGLFFRGVDACRIVKYRSRGRGWRIRNSKLEGEKMKTQILKGVKGLVSRRLTVISFCLVLTTLYVVTNTAAQSDKSGNPKMS